MKPHRRAVVFGPVQPAFDPGFFDPITGWLIQQGYTVEILDSLAVIEDRSMTLTDVAEEWVRRRPDLTEVDLLCGNAFGGAVVQAMLAGLASDIAVLGLSAPTVADGLLSERLGEIADHARAGDLARALDRLDDLVRSDALAAPATATRPTVTDQSAACRRIELGMSLLCDLDASEAVTTHRGPVLGIVGNRSRLVTARHVRLPTHGVLADIPDAGMRPHCDAAAAVDAVLFEQRGYLAGVTNHSGAPSCRSDRTETKGAA